MGKQSATPLPQQKEAEEGNLKPPLPSSSSSFPSPQHAVLGNQEVLGRILSFLPTIPDLKAASLTCKGWERVARAALLPRSFFHLTPDTSLPQTLETARARGHFPTRMQLSGPLRTSQLPPLYALLSHVGKGVQSLSLSFHQEGTERAEESESAKEEEDGRCEFLTKGGRYFGQALETLKVQLTAEVADRLLLHCEKHCDCQPFQGVRKYLIGSGCSEEESLKYEHTDLAARLLYLCPAARELELTSLFAPVFQEMQEEPGKYQEIRSLLIRPEVSLHQTSPRSNAATFALLPELDLRLTKLVLDNFHFEDEQGPALFSKILVRWKDTLEHLEVGRITFSEDTKGTIVWPRMPKLKTLMIYHGNPSFPDFNPEQPLVCADFLFETAEFDRGKKIEYMEQFPRVEQLVVRSCNLSQEDRFRHSFEIYKILFPHDNDNRGRNWESVRHVELDFPSILPGDGDPLRRRYYNCWNAGKYYNYARFVSKMAKILPNAIQLRKLLRRKVNPREPIREQHCPPDQPPTSTINHHP